MARFVTEYAPARLAAGIRKDKRTVVIFGARVVGEAMLLALKSHDIKVSVFADNDTAMQGSIVRDTRVVVPASLGEVARDALIFVASSSVEPILLQLERLGFAAFYSCLPFLDQWNTDEFALSANKAQVARSLRNYRFMSMAWANAKGCYIASLDVVVTERCSLRCRDCANLMQYYEKPVHCDPELLLSALDRFMSAVDHVGDVPSSVKI